MNIKSMLAVMSASVATAALSAVPEATNVTFGQSESTRKVTITYKLTAAPAVVTIDIQTNAGANAWISIGGRNLTHFTGDVNRMVSGKETYTATWRPDLAWAGNTVPAGKARAVVTAWAPDNTPDYMAVDLTKSAADPVRYYADADSVPGGVLSNTAYRTTVLLMRKIMAKDVVWTMGSVNEAGRAANNEMAHEVQLTNNYYIGVFPITQTQWQLAGRSRPTPSAFNRVGYGMMRPVENVCYNEIRVNNGQSYLAGYDWPKAPHPSSFLGELRNRTKNAYFTTGVDFDLPSEAEWEFAARAGHGEGYWGNGLPILSTKDNNYKCPNFLGRYSHNGGTLDGGTGGTSLPTPANCDDQTGTPIVGTSGCNDWGLYDMNGSVFECCLDWYEEDITSTTVFNGKVNVDPDDASKTLSGAPGSNRVGKGGAWRYQADIGRSAYRYQMKPESSSNLMGLRVACRAGLK